mmetsp:Transcript_3424/g.9997  ORF Transcript_3424/g.9997 Transcript_3424/m.9997 type:complete len:206 (-) Transcript_3424:368-985(-)
MARHSCGLAAIFPWCVIARASALFLARTASRFRGHYRQGWARPTPHAQRGKKAGMGASALNRACGATSCSCATGNIIWTSSTKSTASSQIVAMHKPGTWPCACASCTSKEASRRRQSSTVTCHEPYRPLRPCARTWPPAFRTRAIQTLQKAGRVCQSLRALRASGLRSSSSPTGSASSARSAGTFIALARNRMRRSVSLSCATPT